MKGWKKCAYAWMMARLSRYADAHVRPYKERLFVGLRGRVLEIGPGTGPNLPYYPERLEWIGLEPNPHMFRYLREAMEGGQTRRLLVCGRAEEIALADESVDVVVSTHVLCSVSDPERALREIRRVLVPGGRFLFIEHVAAPERTPLRRWQMRLRPLWTWLADGCHPDRETDRLIQEAGFAQVTLWRFLLPAPLISPHIAGVAIKGERFIPIGAAPARGEPE